MRPSKWVIPLVRLAPLAATGPPGPISARLRALLWFGKQKQALDLRPDRKKARLLT